jgi:hypothetical protein
VETVWNASLHIMGSRSFHDMAAYWPTSTMIFAPPMNQDLPAPRPLKLVSSKAFPGGAMAQIYRPA